VGAEDLEDAVADRQDGAIEGAAAQVVDSDGAGSLAVEAISEGGGGRLVDDTEHVETGKAAGVTGGPPLAIVAVSGDGDDRPRRVAGRAADLLEEEGGKLLRRVLVPADLDVQHLAAGFDLALHHLVGNELQLLLEVGKRFAHEALDAVDRVVWIAE